jgi:diguanylate cyclase (GGDEF)-like protein
MEELSDELTGAASVLARVCQALDATIAELAVHADPVPVVSVWAGGPSAFDPTATSRADELIALAAELEELKQLALVDHVTGLPNRVAWEDALVRELARARRKHESVCVALLTIDGLEQIAGRYGREASDRILKEASEAWRLTVRASDVLARYSDEEFALLLPTWPVETTQPIVDRVRRATPQGHRCSAGLAEWSGTETVEELLGRAGSALYQAQSHGGGQTLLAR